MSGYLIFEKETVKGRKTPIYNVKNKSDEILGVIYFYPAWRKYVFQPVPIDHIIFDTSCLDQIVMKLLEVNWEWKNDHKSVKK